MKIVFMGTPDFAVGTLRALREAGHEIAAVFTQPDKPVGRKMILTPPPVKQLALEYGVPVYQPTTLRDGQALAVLREIKPDLIVVVAYGKILPKEILTLPPFGCMNVHGSLLPKYRGASPIQWCIVQGETETGVTTMLMDEGMDTGDMLESESVTIGETETAEQLYDRLAVLGANLAVHTVKGLQEGTVTPQKQDESLVTYAPIITKEMGQIDFSKPATAIVNLVRGLHAWPTAFFMSEGSRVKVYEASAEQGDGKPCGTVLCSKGKLTVQCGENTAVTLTEIQPEGKGKMTATAWLNGKPIAVGSILS